MKPHIKVDVTVGTLASLTAEQFKALQDNILADGTWETASGLRLMGGGDHLSVMPMEVNLPEFPTGQREMMYIGIEKDGYTHS